MENVQPGTEAEVRYKNQNYFLWLIRVWSAGYSADSTTKDEDLFVAPADAKPDVIGMHAVY